VSEFFSRVTVVCFACSYLVSLAAEVCRLKLRVRIADWVLYLFTVAGLFAHTVYLYFHAVAPNRVPLSSERDFYLVAAWVLAGVYLYLLFKRPHSPFGLFLLPLVLALIGIAVFFADPVPFPRGPATRVWGTIHGVSILIATVCLFLGFVAGVLYLWQVYRLKRKLLPLRAIRLPSVEWLQKANNHAVVASVVTVGIGLLSGVVLNLISQDQRVSWHDPVVVSTWLMFAWLVVAVVSGLVYRPMREGHKVAYLTLVSFLFLILVLVTGLFFSTEHGARRGPTRPPDNRPAELERQSVRRAVAKLAGPDVRTASPTRLTGPAGR